VTTKSQFVKECEDLMIKHMPIRASKSSLDEMIEMKLKNLKDSDIIEDRKMDDCTSVLFARITLFKGRDDAEEFLHEIDRWRGYE
jgi:hypothetical protein